MSHDTTPLTVVAEFLAAPGQEGRLRTALEGMIEPSLEEPGCLAYRPYTDPNNPARMAIVEEWTGPQALDAHFATAHFHHVRQVLDLVLDEPMTIRKLVAAAPAS
ncbi:putative quinol monooxygenase [Streptomyces sp. NPDC050738]|uniref:putative quinol monooxygenase n=1 Tax=Streptomyces sp. NPDC050738 TaxID=3154744 RepID=UPI0034298E87